MLAVLETKPPETPAQPSSGLSASIHFGPPRSWQRQGVESSSPGPERSISVGAVRHLPAQKGSSMSRRSIAELSCWLRPSAHCVGPAKACPARVRRRAIRAIRLWLGLGVGARATSVNARQRFLENPGISLERIWACEPMSWVINLSTGNRFRRGARLPRTRCLPRPGEAWQNEQGARVRARALG